MAAPHVVSTSTGAEGPFVRCPTHCVNASLTHWCHHLSHSSRCHRRPRMCLPPPTGKSLREVGGEKIWGEETIRSLSNTQESSWTAFALQQEGPPVAFSQRLDWKTVFKVRKEME